MLLDYVEVELRLGLFGFLQGFHILWLLALVVNEIVHFKEIFECHLKTLMILRINTEEFHGKRRRSVGW